MIYRWLFFFLDWASHCCLLCVSWGKMGRTEIEIHQTKTIYFLNWIQFRFFSYTHINSYNMYMYVQHTKMFIFLFRGIIILFALVVVCSAVVYVLLNLMATNRNIYIYFVWSRRNYRTKSLTYILLIPQTAFISYFTTSARYGNKWNYCCGNLKIVPFSYLLLIYNRLFHFLECHF